MTWVKPKLFWVWVLHIMQHIMNSSLILYLKVKGLAKICLSLMFVKRVSRAVSVWKINCLYIYIYMYIRKLGINLTRIKSWHSFSIYKFCQPCKLSHAKCQICFLSQGQTLCFFFYIFLYFLFQVINPISICICN